MDSKKDLQSRHSISLKPSISDLQDALLCFINIINFRTTIITYCEVFSIKLKVFFESFFNESLWQRVQEIGNIL